VCYISEQFIQLGDTLLDIPNLRLPLNDQRILEIDFVLRSQSQLLL
jgi:hypothetical protein